MRRKQLYAIMLAGALAASSAPAAVFAAEDVTATAESADVAATSEESAETPAEGETTPEAPAEPETPAEPEAPAAPETPAEQPAAPEAPAEQPAAPEAPVAETPAETPAEQTGEEAAPTPTTEAEGESLVTGESTTPTNISITVKSTEEGVADKVRYFDTLQHAIDAAPEYNAETNKDATVIEVSGQIELDTTVTVPANKKVCIRATNAVTISRKAGTLTADMFQVSGENAELQFDVKEGAENASLTVSGAFDEANTQAVAGSIVKVSEKAAFGIGKGVTLKDNNTTADGGAITCQDGSIVLKGGEISGNTGAKAGGIYTNKSIGVQGTVVVKENHKGTDVSNICLEGMESVITVTDVLTNSDISFTHVNAADALAVVKAGSNGDGVALSADKFKTVIDAADATKSQIKYENTAAFTLALAADNLSLTLAKVGGETPAEPSPAPSVTPSVSPAVTPTVAPAQKLTLSYKSGSIAWVDHSTLTVTYANNVAYKWDYYFVDPNTTNTQITAINDGSKLSNSVDTVNKEYTMKISSVPTEKKWLVICAKPENGKPIYKVFKLNTLYRSSADKKAGKTFWSQRPADPSKATREVRTYKVTKSEVTGLENALKFFPAKRYDFTVVGAGQKDTDPITGDERWIPIYWSTSKNPTSDDQKNTSWKIGSNKGIKDAKTYTMYIFFRKQTYTEGSGWNDTDVIQAMPVKFTSAGYTEEELKAYLEEQKEEGNEVPGYENYPGVGGSGDDTDAELTATAAASEKDAGSKSKSAVSTADESPLGTMSALAALSLLAGGYVIVRKRKKDEI